ncbi:MAG TPA: gamma-glutamylcyclotransferase family protein [Desulfuromonadales bacterium]|nr:gamma-glutamylcyclotransferase family protein [Desulfuromonadales bacterium]
MLYFAYGHNMDEEVLRERGVAFTTIGKGKARNVRLVFHKPAGDGTGMADLQDAHGSEVEGVVFDVPEESLSRLDFYEQVDKGHYRRGTITVQTSRGELFCEVYRAAKFRSGLKPRPEYLAMLIHGAEQHRLSSGYLTFLKSHVCAGEGNVATE